MRSTETILNETYLSLGCFVRDLNLSKEYYQLYRKGRIITEPSFIEMTYRLGGMNSKLNTRFVILSNKANDMRFLEEDTAWGLFVIRTHAYFKVLTRFQVKGKHVIVLLQIDELDVSFFKHNEVSFDKDLVQQVKEQMNSLLSQEPVKETDNNLWYRHTNFPIGLKDDGAFY